MTWTIIFALSAVWCFTLIGLGYKNCIRDGVSIDIKQAVQVMLALGVSGLFVSCLAVFLYTVNIPNGQPVIVATGEAKIYNAKIVSENNEYLYVATSQKEKDKEPRLRKIKKS